MLIYNYKINKIKFLKMEELIEQFKDLKIQYSD